MFEKESSDKLSCVVATNSLWNAYNFRLNLLRSIKNLGIEVYIIAPIDQTKELLEKEGFKIIHINIASHSKNPVKDFSLLLNYYKLIKKISPKFILGFTIKPNIYATMASIYLRIPVINNITGFGSVFLRNSPIKMIIKLAYRIIFKYSFTIFCQNSEDKKYVLSTLKVNKDNVKLLPGSGVNLKKFDFVPISKNNSNNFKFLFIGRLLKAKGVIEYINAAKMILSHRDDIYFNLLGEYDPSNPDSMPKNLFNSARKYKNISFLGYKDDVKKTIAESDCVVLPSFSEGSPKSLIESIAIGRPIIGSNISGIRQILADERNGYLCEPKDTESLLEAFKKMIDTSMEDRIKMSLECRKIAETKFDESIVIKKYIEQVRKILKYNK